MMPSLGARSAFIEYMKQLGIGTPFHYVPLHDAPAGRRFGRVHGPMRVTDRVSATLVRMPMFFDLGSDVEAVIDAVTDYLSEGRVERTA
jgi:dTDP-4-amino-4,6-dideoxygalactose transaminase